ncbi:hypothetical protein LX36DRAFT_576704 [Colletotrichum falcatum]|nr:hypothetical protein LX36DRAFT_576704 [Colletotrichum falcatum]
MVFLDLYVALVAWLRGPVLNNLARGWVKFSWTLPILLVGLFFLNSFAVWEVLYSRIISDQLVSPFAPWFPSQISLAWGLLGVYSVLAVNSYGCILWCWYLSLGAKGYQMPSGSVAPRPRTVMQTDYGISRQTEFPLSGMDGCRPNWCRNQPCLNSGAWRGDRMYHCSEKGYNRCLPVFDHYCFWLWVPVYLNTIKAYCLFMPLLFLYSAFSLAVVSWSIHMPQTRGHNRWSYPAVAISLVFACFAAFDMGKYQWKSIVFQNRVGKERGRRWLWYMAIKQINGRVVLDEPDDNPYDLGSRWANAQEVLGRWYQMPFWFWSPARVGQYGHHLNLDNDTTISPAYVSSVTRRYEVVFEHPPLPPPPPRGWLRRRHNASSSMV